MKTISTKSLLCLFAGLLLISGISSCKKEENNMPVITRVRAFSKSQTVNGTRPYNLDSTFTTSQIIPLPFDSTVNSGTPGNMYAIVGEHLGTATSIEFNGVAANLNPALFKDDLLIVTIPPAAPWQTQKGTVVVTTKYGTASFAFNISPPAPTISAVSQLAGAAGETITITGTNMDNTSGVKFGNAAAEIVSVTSTEVKVKIPANALGVITLTTPGGTASGPYESYNGVAVPILNPFGFNYVFYDDAVDNAGEFGFNGHEVDQQNTEVVKRGTHAIKVTFKGNYAGYALTTNAPVDLTDKTYLKFSIYGSTGTEGKIIKVTVNDFDHRQVSVMLHADKWSTYSIPLTLFQNSSQPGKPTSLGYVGFQELSGNAPEIIYLDDIGVY